MISIFMLVDNRAKARAIAEGGDASTGVADAGVTSGGGGVTPGLAELPEQIEQFGRDLLVHRTRIDRTQSMSDIAIRRLPTGRTLRALPGAALVLLVVAQRQNAPSPSIAACLPVPGDRPVSIDTMSR
jgi:hypothetical protein